MEFFSSNWWTNKTSQVVEPELQIENRDCLHSFVAFVLLWNVCPVYSTYHLCIHDSVCSLPEATITREVRTAVATSACAIRYAYRTVNTGVVLGLHGNRTDHLSTAHQPARHAHNAPALPGEDCLLDRRTDRQRHVCSC